MHCYKRIDHFSLGLILKSRCCLKLCFCLWLRLLQSLNHPLQLLILTLNFTPADGIFTCKFFHYHKVLRGISLPEYPINKQCPISTQDVKTVTVFQHSFLFITLCNHKLDKLKTSGSPQHQTDQIQAIEKIENMQEEQLQSLFNKKSLEE